MIAKAYRTPEATAVEASDSELDEDTEEAGELSKAELDEDEAYDTCMETRGYCDHDHHDQ